MPRLRQRVEQLEEQLVDMQVVVGTLESLARGAPARIAGAGPRAIPGAAAAIECRRRRPARQHGDADPGARRPARAAAGAGARARRTQRRAAAQRPSAGNDPPAARPSPRPGRPQAEANATAAERTGFGSVTVSPDTGRRDEIDRILSRRSRAPGPPRGERRPPPTAPAEAEVEPKQLYETAYGYLLQRDYGAAEAAFEEFLRRHPNDPLAGNAQYWLGESLYVRGQYRAAAGAFLKGYQTYGRSAKAPESLLKLAMSLQRLGQKDAACSSYSELTTKFPNAPAHVKSTAQAERQRAGC